MKIHPKTSSRNRCEKKGVRPDLPGGSAARAGAPLRLNHLLLVSSSSRLRLVLVSRNGTTSTKHDDRWIAKATDATHIAVRRSLVSGCESECAMRREHRRPLTL